MAYNDDANVQLESWDDMGLGTTTGVAQAANVVQGTDKIKQ